MKDSYTFSKKEKLCLKKQIDAVFSNGRWLRSEHIRLLYMVSEENLPATAQILFSVPKKFHRRAVKRNLLKRRMREVYRLIKPEIYSQIEPTGKQILIGIVYSSSEVCEYGIIKFELTNLLFQVASRINRIK